MKVLLKVDVDNLGLAGEVYDVAPGFGRNYLLPQGLAVKATNRVMKQAIIWRQVAEVRRAEIRAEHDKLAASISEVELSFIARAGQTGKLYGSITTAQIADKLNEVLGTEIDRRKVGNDSLRQLGEHEVIVRLSADHVPTVTVIVKPEDEIDVVLDDSEDAELDTDAMTTEAIEPASEEEEDVEIEPVDEPAEDVAVD